MFNDNVKEFLKKEDKLQLIEEIEEILAFHDSNYIAKLKPLPEKPKRMLGQNGLHFLQLSLFRSREIINGIISMINDGNEISFGILTRTHFETTAAVAYFLKKLQNFYSNQITYEQLDDSIGRLSLGIRAKGDLQHAPDPISVMNLIDAADSLFSKMTNNKTPVFRNSYEDLSEFSHPNSFGLQLGSTINKQYIVRYKSNNRDFHLNMYFFSSFLCTATAFLLFCKPAKELILKNEETPEIILH